MMETRYYSEKGRPGGEHKLALHASRRVFDRITGHLYRKERIREDLAKEAAHRKYLRDETRAMTSQWDNSVDNLRKKKEEARQQKLAQKADDRVEQYFKVLKFQAAEREAYNKEVAKKLFLLRGAQREINSSVLYSECLYANEKHIEHKNREKEKAVKDWREYEQQIIEEDRKFKEDELMKECKRRTAAERHLHFLKNQISEKEKIRDEEAKIKLETETTDIAKQEEELKIIRKNKEEDFLKAKRCSMKILEDSRKEKVKKREIAEKQDVELETVCGIYRDARVKLNCARERMRKLGIQKRLDNQEKVSKKLEEIQKQQLDDEEEIIANAIAEKDEEDMLKKRLREEYDKRLLRERKANYDNALQEEKNKEEIEKEKRKIEMLNRIKLMEICEKEEKQRQENKLNQKKMYTGMLDEQVKENESIRAEEKAKNDAFKWNDFPEKDQKFLEYGEEMLEKQRAAGKSTYPIERAIMDYKKKHCLIPVKPKTSVTKGSGAQVKLPMITRRICPNKNISTGVQDCFCTQ